MRNRIEDQELKYALFMDNLASHRSKGVIFYSIYRALILTFRLLNFSKTTLIKRSTMLLELPN